MYYNDTRIIPAPNISYNTETNYKNDVATGHKYKITLDGYIMASDFVGGVAEGMTYINNLFSSNGHTLQVDSHYLNGVSTSIFLANSILVRSIRFSESNNNWVKYSKYTVEMESSNVLVGEDLRQHVDRVKNGGLNTDAILNMGSHFMNNMESYTIQDWSEQFDIQTGDNQIQRTTVVEKRFEYNLPISQTPLSIVTTLGGEHFDISYTVQATGKQNIKKVNNQKRMLPAWEHAKRFVHTKLLQQMGGLFQTFLSMNGSVLTENIGANNGNGVFANFRDLHNLGVTNLPSFALYNEHVSFDVSESDGTFSATYNAIIKRDCPTDDVGGNYNNSYVLYCGDNVLHTVSKTVTKTYEANETPTIANQQTAITLNGTITGLVPGGILNPQSKIHINNLTTGSFLCYNTSATQYSAFGAGGGFDKSFYAGAVFDYIFDYSNFDLKPGFKDLLGVTAYALNVSPTASLKPSSMNVTRNVLNGTISYSATYDTKYNCDPNNFEIHVSTSQPIPVVAEFVVPNNNIKDINGVLCDNGKGYSVLQLLGTYTPKTIDVSIKANVGADFNKCCLGTSDNWNLFDYNFIQLESFIIPQGMNIPYISDSYALTKKTKSVTYPRGDMSFSLSYVCADFCEITDYFADKGIPHDNVRPQPPPDLDLTAPVLQSQGNN